MANLSLEPLHPLLDCEQLVFVTGMQGSGKTSIATAALEDTHSLLDMGPAMKALHSARSDGTTYEGWLSVNEERDKLFVPKIIASIVANQIEGSERFAIVGPRSVQVINALRQLLAVSNTMIAYVEVPYAVRKQRYESRLGYQKTMSFETAESYNMRLGTHLIANVADIIIDNSGSFNEATSLLISAAKNGVPTV